MLATLLSLDRRVNGTRDALRCTAEQLYEALGDNVVHKEGAHSEAAGTLRLAILTQGNAHSLCPALVESLGQDLAEAERAFAWMQRAAALEKGGEGGADSETTEELEAALCERFTSVIGVLRMMSKSALEAGSWTVDEAATGEEALRMFVAANERPAAEGRYSLVRKRALLRTNLMVALNWWLTSLGNPTMVIVTSACAATAPGESCHTAP